MRILFFKSFRKKTVNVKGYTRHNGTEVSGYDREMDASEEKPKAPDPRNQRFPLLSPDMKPEQYLSHVMRAFGASRKETRELPELAGYHRHVSAQMFTTAGAGKLKITKNDRHVYLNYIIDAVKHPQEMWVDSHDQRDKTLYCLARYRFGKKTLHIVATFKEESVSVWLGWSAFQSESKVYYESKREGKCVYSAP